MCVCVRVCTHTHTQKKRLNFFFLRRPGKPRTPSSIRSRDDIKHLQTLNTFRHQTPALAGGRRRRHGRACGLACGYRVWCVYVCVFRFRCVKLTEVSMSKSSYSQRERDASTCLLIRRRYETLSGYKFTLDLRVFSISPSFISYGFFRISSNLPLFIKFTRYLREGRRSARRLRLIDIRHLHHTILL